MANEAVIIELLGKVPGRPVRFTCADGTGIEKGTLMHVHDPRTAVTTDADNNPFCGIAAHEKVASDGQLSIACYTHGIFDILGNAAATILIGEKVSIAAANGVSKVAAADLLFADVGIALEEFDKSEVGAVLVGAMF